MSSYTPRASVQREMVQTLLASSSSKPKPHRAFGAFILPIRTTAGLNFSASRRYDGGAQQSRAQRSAPGRNPALVVEHFGNPEPGALCRLRRQLAHVVKAAFDDLAI